MNIQFYKYQGAGNDFILIDNRALNFNHSQPEVIAKLCDRRFGIGADGIMFLQSKPGFDFEMVYYNADGQPSSMCGNGGRCIMAFAKHLGVIENEATFLAVDGSHYAKISGAGDWVSLQMKDVAHITTDNNAYVLDTGSPHYVQFAEKLNEKDVYADGFAIRNNDIYRDEGINVNFVEPEGEGFFMRTFERGVEDETYACGTGATAVALAMAKHQNRTGKLDVPIRVMGGNLNIRFNYDGNKFSSIFLEGPATKVFEGAINIS